MIGAVLSRWVSQTDTAGGVRALSGLAERTGELGLSAPQLAARRPCGPMCRRACRDRPGSAGESEHDWL